MIRRVSLALVLALGALGCGTAYKNALCNLSTASAGVSTHYQQYVDAEPNADTKAAREAEATQFKQAVAEAATTCAK